MATSAFGTPLVSVAELLRAYHDAASTFDLWFYRLIRSGAAHGHAAFTKLWTRKTMPRAELTM